MAEGTPIEGSPIMSSSLMDEPVVAEAPESEPDNVFIDYFGRFMDRLCRPANPLAATLMRDVRGIATPLSAADERDLHVLAIQSDDPVSTR